MTRVEQEAGYLRVGMFNVRGIRAREVEIRELMARERLDVLVVTETFLADDQNIDLR